MVSETKVRNSDEDEIDAESEEDIYVTAAELRKGNLWDDENCQKFYKQ